MMTSQEPHFPWDMFQALIHASSKMRWALPVLKLLPTI